MANPGQTQSPLDITDDDVSRYLVESKKEVAFILRSIAQKGEGLTAHFNQGNDFILTSIIEVDADNNTVILDYGANEALDRKILEARKIVFITAQDKVRVQFTVNRIEKTRYDGNPAFKISLPESLIKLQRREYYRLATPISKPLVCTFPLEGGSKVNLAIADISIGGIGVVNPPSHFKFEIGATHQGCYFVLPETGTIVAALQIRNAFEITLKNGSRVMRAGCMFVNLPGTMESMIQRYIIKLERERRALQMDD
ncbi:MAG: flagellar brake protein [Sulfuricellaceae bacterium]